MTSYPPPPPAAAPTGTTTKAPMFGWAAPVAGLLGLLALFLPWFTPFVKANGVTSTADTSFHAWNGYRFLILAPILLVVFGVLWALALLGRSTGKFAKSDNPLRALSLQSIIVGLVSLVISFLAFPIFTSTYKIKGSDTGNLSWSAADKLIKAGGGTLSKGPQIGLYLLMAGAVVLTVVGVLGLLASKQADPAGTNGLGAPATGSSAFPPAAGSDQQAAFPPAGGYGQPAAPAPGAYPAPGGYSAPGA